MSVQVERVVAQFLTEGLAESCTSLLKALFPGLRFSLCRGEGAHLVTVVQEVADERAPFTEAQEAERAEVVRALYGRGPSRCAS